MGFGIQRVAPTPLGLLLLHIPQFQATERWSPDVWVSEGTEIEGASRSWEASFAYLFLEFKRPSPWMNCSGRV